MKNSLFTSGMRNDSSSATNKMSYRRRPAPLVLSPPCPNVVHGDMKLTAETYSAVRQLKAEMESLFYSNKKCCDVRNLTYCTAEALASKDPSHLAYLQSIILHKPEYSCPPEKDPVAVLSLEHELDLVSVYDQCAIWMVLQSMAKGERFWDDGLLSAALSGFRRVRSLHYGVVEECTPEAGCRPYSDLWPLLSEHCDQLRSWRKKIQRSEVKSDFDSKFRQLLPEGESEVTGRSQRTKAIIEKNSVIVAWRRVNDFLDNPWLSKVLSQRIQMHRSEDSRDYARDCCPIVDEFVMRALIIGLGTIPGRIEHFVASQDYAKNLSPHALKTAQACAIMPAIESIASQCRDLVDSMWEEVIERWEEHAIWLMSSGAEVLQSPKCSPSDRDRVSALCKKVNFAVFLTEQRVEAASALQGIYKNATLPSSVIASPTPSLPSTPSLEQVRRARHRLKTPGGEGLPIKSRAQHGPWSSSGISEGPAKPQKDEDISELITAPAPSPRTVGGGHAVSLHLSPRLLSRQISSPPLGPTASSRDESSPQASDTPNMSPKSEELPADASGPNSLARGLRQSASWSETARKEPMPWPILIHRSSLSDTKVLSEATGFPRLVPESPPAAFP